MEGFGSNRIEQSGYDLCMLSHQPKIVPFQGNPSCGANEGLLICGEITIAVAQYRAHFGCSKHCYIAGFNPYEYSKWDG